jgi:putative sigma-54 modulation protein
MLIHELKNEGENSMELTIQAINFEATDKLKTFVDKKIKKLERFNDGILNADVVMRVVKPEVAKNKEVTVKLNLKNGEAFAEKVGDTFEEAVDLCAEALEKQIFKAKEKKGR